MKKSQSQWHSIKDVTNNFQRRKIIFMKKTDELRSEFNCNIYILKQRNKNLFNYTFKDESFWSLSLTEIVSDLKICKIRVILKQKDIHWLVSQNKTLNLCSVKIKRDKTISWWELRTFRLKT